MAEETANRLADYIRSGRSVPNAGANALRRLIGGVGDYAAERYNTARYTVANALYAAANPQEASQEFAAAVSRQPAPFQPVGEQDMETAMSFWNPGGMLGKIVWHGSPHKFTKFDASKIGTGEGAQQQAVGSYLADAQEVGQKYADKEAAKRGLNQGYLYKADIPDELIEKMGIQDVPLKDQPQSVKRAISTLIDGRVTSALKNGFGWESAEDAPLAAVMNALDAVRWGDRAKTAADMKKAGISGIRYLDGGSRSAGQGSYNYVVFPGLEDQIKILERNGEPLNALLK